MKRQQHEDAHLHDGRKAFIDGNRFRDENGALLEGRDHYEASGLRKLGASTWQERQKAADEAAAQRIRQKVLRESGRAGDDGGESREPVILRKGIPRQHGDQGRTAGRRLRIV